MANQLRMAKIDAILALHRRKWSIRRIAKELGLHRDTVARHLQLDNARSKPARAPLGSAGELSVCAEARPASAGKAPMMRNRPPRRGAQRSKQATQAEAPIGSTAPDARARQASLCEPWRQIILDKLEAGLTAQAQSTRTWLPTTGSQASTTACAVLSVAWGRDAPYRSGAWNALPARKSRSTSAAAFRSFSPTASAAARMSFAWS